MTQPVIAFLLNARGDHLLCLPAVRALADFCRRRGEPFVLAARRHFSEIFFRDASADAIVAVDAEYRDGAYAFDVPTVIQDLDAHGPGGTFVSLNPWHSGEVEQLMDGLRPRLSIGFAPGFDVALPLDFSRHSSELAFDAARALNPDARLASWATPPALQHDAVAAAVTLRRILGNRPLLAVHPDSKQQKAWTPEGWRALVDDWLRRRPSGLVLDLGLGDGTMWSECVAPDRVLGGLRLTLADALAMVTVADRFVGVDSCFLHAADLSRIPSIGLFGPTDPHEFGLLWAPHRHLVRAETATIPPGDVIAALVELETELQSDIPVICGRATPDGTERYATSSANAAPGHFRTALGLQLSSIGLGTAGFRGDRDLDAVESTLVLLGRGCNVIDVAANHGGGFGIVLTGQALRRAFWSGTLIRESVFVVSKAGFLEHLAPAERSRVASSGEHDLSPRYLQWEVDQQRRLLGLDTIDAFLLQNPEETLAAQGMSGLERTLKAAFEVLEGATRDGRIGWYGISTAEALRVPRGDPRAIDLEVMLAWAHDVAGPDHRCRVVELPANIVLTEALDTRAHGSNGAARSALAYAADRELLLLASRSLNGGGEKELSDLSQSMGSFIPVLDDPGARMLQATRSLPGVTVALAGASRPAHARSLATVIATAPLCLDDLYRSA